MRTLKKSNLEFLEKIEENPIHDILLHRGLSPEIINSPSFQSPTFKDFYDPFLFPWMDKAVERILQARTNKERVVVFGDYDVDGVSSTALLVRFFSSIGIEISYRLPHRIHDGYGMKQYFMDELATKWVTLVISVDCGTKDIEVINHAKSLGIDIIVTDHHAVPDVIPENAIALLNPKMPNSSYPFSGLAGSGVALKLLHAVSLKLYPEDMEKVEKMVVSACDFACLGTISDMMPLIDENRIIVKLGLKGLTKSKSNGLKKLIEGKDINADIVGFHIGPRINAAGRMDSPYKALSLLLASENRVDELLSEIESLNAKRKTSCEYFITHALGVAKIDQNILFYESDEIEHGIIGLISWRLTEAHGKPSIVLKREDEKMVASCRAPEGFDLAKFLENFSERFVAFGGHKQAAGFTILTKNYEAFKKEALLHANEIIAREPLPKKTMKIDRILSLEEITTSFVQNLHSIAPYGIGFEKPLFLVRSKDISIERLGQDGKHLRFPSKSWKGKINAFGFWEFFEELKRTTQNISFVAELSEETWMRQKSLVLNVKEIVIES